MYYFISPFSFFTILFYPFFTFLVFYFTFIFIVTFIYFILLLSELEFSVLHNLRQISISINFNSNLIWVNSGAYFVCLQDRENAQSSCAGLFIGSHLGFDWPGIWVHVDIASPVHAVSIDWAWTKMMHISPRSVNNWSVWIVDRGSEPLVSVWPCSWLCSARRLMTPCWTLCPLWVPPQPKLPLKTRWRGTARGEDSSKMISNCS